MKKLIVAIALAFALVGTRPASAQDPVDEDIKLLRKDLRSLRKQIIAANLDLSDKEAVQFWPLFERYTQELVAKQDQKYALLKEYAQDYTTITDEQAEKYIRGRAGVEQDDGPSTFEILAAVSKGAVGKIHGDVFSTGLAPRIDHGPSARFPNSVDRAVTVFQTNRRSRRSTHLGGLMRPKFIALLMGLLALGGCAGVRYPNYYTLNLPNPLSTSHGSAPISGTVVVREFRGPEYLKQGRIVYRPEPEQIAFYDYHHWAEDPGQTVTAAIMRNLQQVFKSAELYDGRTDADFPLTGSLDRLEELDNDRSVSVDVGISAMLRNLKTGDVIWSGTSSKTSAVAQRSISGIVAVMSRDLSEATGQLVASLRNELSRSALSSRWTGGN